MKNKSLSTTQRVRKALEKELIIMPDDTCIMLNHSGMNWYYMVLRMGGTKWTMVHVRWITSREAVAITLYTEDYKCTRKV